MKGKSLTAAVFVVSMGALVGCETMKPDQTKVEVKNCGPDGDKVCVTVTGTWNKSTANADDLVRDMVVTREVAPELLAYSNGIAKGTITLTLNNGSKVSYNGNLAYSSYWSTRVPARTSGNRVYGFVAANPSAVENFINQYKSQATSLAYTSSITLDNIWTGEAESTVIESQASHQGVRAFLGSGIGSAGGRDGGPIEY